ncbi:endolysin [Streptomyces sp. NPDC023838]|uniref:endolysin n=1 Tax=Streptomyces sp. NPDC023838 TaxID=3154325 RepID=UPI00340D178D
MPDLWMPGASRLALPDTAPTDGGPAKAIAHITWDRNASASAPADLVPFSSLRSYFGGSGSSAAPHILWNPFTGEVTQFYPATSRSKSVVDSAGGTRTNRAGSVVIQIECLFFPYCRVDGRVYPRLVDTPCKGWEQLHAWVRSWGVPDVWPMGRPVDFTSHRDEATWETHGGWYAHAHVPENDHQDPGSWPQFTTTSEEDDMTPDQAKQLAEIRSLVQFGTWAYKGDGTFDAWALLNALYRQSLAQGAALTALTRAVGDLHSGVDTATLVAAVQKAIADAVVDVDVTVHDATPTT